MASNSGNNILLDTDGKIHPTLQLEPKDKTEQWVWKLEVLHDHPIVVAPRPFLQAMISARSCANLLLTAVTLPRSPCELLWFHSEVLQPHCRSQWSDYKVLRNHHESKVRDCTEVVDYASLSWISDIQTVTCPFPTAIYATGACQFHWNETPVDYHSLGPASLKEMTKGLLTERNLYSW